MFYALRAPYELSPPHSPASSACNVSLPDNPNPRNSTNSVVGPTIAHTYHDKHHSAKSNPQMASSKTNGAAPINTSDILAYEDSWVGWDGPVWCSRFGRFENQEDAARDDGLDHPLGSPKYEGLCPPLRYSIPAHKLIDCICWADRQLHRCEKSTCGGGEIIPAEHHAYVHDIKRRIEPMTESLVRLEHQVQALAHHVIRDSSTYIHTGHFHDKEDGKNNAASNMTLLSASHHASSSEASGGVEPISTPMNRGSKQELWHPEHAHYKQGYNQEGPTVALDRFKENYNQQGVIEWAEKHEHHHEPLVRKIRELEGEVQSLSRQIKMLLDGKYDSEELELQRLNELISDKAS